MSRRQRPIWEGPNGCLTTLARTRQPAGPHLGSYVGDARRSAGGHEGTRERKTVASGVGDGDRENAGEKCANISNKAGTSTATSRSGGLADTPLFDLLHLIPNTGHAASPLSNTERTAIQQCNIAGCKGGQLRSRGVGYAVVWTLIPCVRTERGLRVFDATMTPNLG